MASLYQKDRRYNVVKKEQEITFMYPVRAKIHSKLQKKSLPPKSSQLVSNESCPYKIPMNIRLPQTNNQPFFERENNKSVMNQVHVKTQNNL